MYISEYRTYIIIDGSNIGNESAKVLSEMIKNSKVLHTLNLSKINKNNIENNAIRTEGARAIAESLKINSSLRILHIGSIKINYRVEFSER